MWHVNIEDSSAVCIGAVVSITGSCQDCNQLMFLHRSRMPKQSNERSGARVKMEIETGRGRNPLLLLTLL